MSEDLEIQTEYELVSISAEAPTHPQAGEGFQWIRAAKEGQVIALPGGLGVITREALESSVGTWKDLPLFDDHKTIKEGSKIYDDEFESPFLYFLLDNIAIGELKKGSGGSIDAFATNIKGDKVTGLKGKGYSILNPKLMPSCTREAGCGIPIAGTACNVNITKKEGEPIVNVDKADSQQKIKAELKNKGGNEEDMADEKPEKPEVTYSAKQVAEIRAAAVAETTEQLDNAHKVGVADIEAAKVAELKTLGETHAAELEMQRELVTKQVGMIESLSAQYSLSDEAKKALTDAKTIEDALALFAGLEITKPIAGEGVAEDSDKKDVKGGGIVEGAAKIEAQAPKTVKVEEVGNYDAVTGKYIPTFREELM
jgi:hypothetical protein